MKHGSASRYGHNKKQITSKNAPRNRSTKRSIRSVSETINNLTGGIKAGLGYLGAENLDILKKQARFVRVTPAGQENPRHMM